MIILNLVSCVFTVEFYVRFKELNKKIKFKKIMKIKKDIWDESYIA